MFLTAVHSLSLQRAQTPGLAKSRGDQLRTPGTPRRSRALLSIQEQHPQHSKWSKAQRGQVRPADLPGLGWAGLDIGPRASICWDTAALGASTGSVRLGLTSCHRNVDLHLGTRNKSLAGEQLSERQIFAASLPVYICSGVSPCERLVHFRRGQGLEEHTWAPNAAAAQLVVKLLRKGSQVQVPALLSPRKGRERVFWSL